MKLFGTDGIRGTAGAPPLDAETVARVGAALVRARHDGRRAMRVLVGRDTRESGVWIEAMLARGLSSEGATLVTTGVMPTPGVAYLARADGFDAGIVISASHNPFEDNGIKIFSGSGEKLSEAYEAEIEREVADPSWRLEALPASDGVVARDLSAHYVTHLTRVLDAAGPLAG